MFDCWFSKSRVSNSDSSGPSVVAASGEKIEQKPSVDVGRFKAWESDLREQAKGNTEIYQILSFLKEFVDRRKENSSLGEDNVIYLTQVEKKLEKITKGKGKISWQGMIGEKDRSLLSGEDSIPDEWLDKNVSLSATVENLPSAQAGTSDKANLPKEPAPTEQSGSTGSANASDKIDNPDTHTHTEQTSHFSDGGVSGQATVPQAPVSPNKPVPVNHGSPSSRAVLTDTDFRVRVLVVPDLTPNILFEMNEYLGVHLNIFISHLKCRKIDRKIRGLTAWCGIKTRNEAEKAKLDLALYDANTKCIASLKHAPGLQNQTKFSKIPLRTDVELLDEPTFRLDCKTRSLVRRLDPIPVYLSPPPFDHLDSRKAKLQRHYIAECRTSVYFQTKRIVGGGPVNGSNDANRRRLDGAGQSANPAQPADPEKLVNPEQLANQDQPPAKVHHLQVYTIVILTYPSNKCDEEDNEFMQSLSTEECSIFEKGSTYTLEDLGNPFFTNNPDFLDQNASYAARSELAGDAQSQSGKAISYYCDQLMLKISSCIEASISAQNVCMNTMKLEILLWACDAAMRSFRLSYHNAKTRLRYIEYNAEGAAEFDPERIKALQDHDAILQDVIYKIDSYQEQLKLAKFYPDDTTSRYQRMRRRKCRKTLHNSKATFERVQAKNKRIQERYALRLSMQVSGAQLKLSAWARVQSFLVGSISILAFLFGAILGLLDATNINILLQQSGNSTQESSGKEDPSTSPQQSYNPPQEVRRKKELAWRIQIGIVCACVLIVIIWGLREYAKRRKRRPFRTRLFRGRLWRGRIWQGTPFWSRPFPAQRLALHHITQEYSARPKGSNPARSITGDADHFSDLRRSSPPQRGRSPYQARSGSRSSSTSTDLIGPSRV